jgi:regulator of cell morphogenesis and NO signaling
LIARIKQHHAYTREALDRLGPLAAKVAGVHAPKRPWLTTLRNLVGDLDEELRPHLMKEERVLFPYIERLEAAAREGRRPATPPFGTVGNPVRTMLLEHDRCAELLRAIRMTTSDYALPSDACVSFAALYAALKELEHDLHEHIHVENNVLFLRAVALEARR